MQDKPIQGQLRHAKAEITRNVYMQQVDPKTYEAVVNLERLGDPKWRLQTRCVAVPETGFCAFVQWGVGFMQTLCKLPPLGSICGK